MTDNADLNDSSNSPTSDDEITDLEAETVNAKITLPNFKNWNIGRIYDFSNQIADYEDLASLGASINAARVGLFMTTQRINEVERKEREAKLKYEREYRRAFIVSMEKTDARKRMRAEIACEEYENDHLVLLQMKEELTRLSNTLRLELQTLQSIGNNLRQQMKME